MRKCNKCLEVKPLSMFSINRSREDGLQLRCKTCNAAYARQWRVDNPKPPSNRTYGPTVDDKRRFLADLRSVPCSDCHQCFPPVCMDFDHLPQFEKEFGIMRAWKYLA